MPLPEFWGISPMHAVSWPDRLEAGELMIATVSTRPAARQISALRGR
jgi:hypothetical protein